MNENLIVCVAVLSTCLVLLAFGVFALSGWLLTKYAKETARTLFQADESRSAAWSLTERALSRITSITFPKGHLLYRQTVGGQVADGAQQHPKPGFVDELEAAQARVGRVNGTQPIAPFVVTEQEEEE